jgi:hypothetical protein
VRARHVVRRHLALKQDDDRPSVHPRHGTERAKRLDVLPQPGLGAPICLTPLGLAPRRGERSGASLPVALDHELPARRRQRQRHDRRPARPPGAEGVPSERGARRHPRPELGQLAEAASNLDQPAGAGEAVERAGRRARGSGARPRVTRLGGDRGDLGPAGAVDGSATAAAAAWRRCASSLARRAARCSPATSPSRGPRRRAPAGPRRWQAARGVRCAAGRRRRWLPSWRGSPTMGLLGWNFRPRCDVGSR